jgi:hypothetical protein
MINVPDIIEQKRVPERVKKKDYQADPFEANVLYSSKSTNISPIKVSGIFDDHPVTIMIDSGSSGNFISKKFVSMHKMKCGRQSEKKIRLANGELEKVGEFVLGRLHINNHNEPIQLSVIRLAGYDVILGMPWLKLHNPEVDWRNGIVRVRDGVTNTFHTFGAAEELLSASSEDDEWSSCDSSAAAQSDLWSAQQVKRASRKSDVELGLAIVKPVAVEQEANLNSMDGCLQFIIHP